MKADNGDDSYVLSFHAQKKEAMSNNSKARSMGASAETVDVIRNLFVYGSLMDRGEAVKDLCPDTWEKRDASIVERIPQNLQQMVNKSKRMLAEYTAVTETLGHRANTQVFEQQGDRSYPPPRRVG